MMSTWKSDLVIGQAAEQELASLLALEGYSISWPTDEERRYYDLVVERPGERVRLEVKHDIETKRTGNVAVEMHRERIKNVIEPAGLSITKADYVVYKIGDEPSFYFIETAALQRYISEKEKTNKLRTVLGGDNNITRLALIRTTEYKSICEQWPSK